MMWRDNETGALYIGDFRIGDRSATDEEIASWEASRNQQPTPVDPVTKLKDFLAENPDVAALIGK